MHDNQHQALQARQPSIALPDVLRSYTPQPEESQTTSTAAPPQMIAAYQTQQPGIRAGALRGAEAARLLAEAAGSAQNWVPSSHPVC